MITQERLKEILDYNPETGDFVWRVTLSNKVVAGSVAGSATSQGYLRITIGETEYRAHRLAWLYVHGEWPKRQIDHINRDKTDNRIANLRDVSASVNCANRGHQNKTGLRGARRNFNGRFQSAIKQCGKMKHLGYFDTAEEAHEAFKRAHIAIYGANSEYYEVAA